MTVTNDLKLELRGWVKMSVTMVGWRQKIKKALTKTSFIVWTVNLILNGVGNNMLSQHNQKAFSLFKFCSKHVCQKKYLQKWWSNISWRPRTVSLKKFESKYLIFLYISVRKFLLQISRKILSCDGIGGWGVAE